MSRSRVRVILVGTGTGVGKTHVACALLRQWSALGINAVGLKPIETGLMDVEEGSDQARLAKAAGTFHVQHSDPAFHVKRSLYGFPEPVSPHLAAREHAVRINLGTIRKWVDQEEGSATIVETAGGLFTPLGSSNTNLELAVALRPGIVILVAPDRLGVLHELTATLGLARARGFVVDRVVLSAPQTDDASTGRNEQELRRLGLADVHAVFPRAAEDDPRTLAAAAKVISWIDLNRAPTGSPDRI